MASKRPRFGSRTVRKTIDADDDAGQTESEEGCPPVVRVRNGARPVGAQPSADRRTECQNGHGHGAPVRRKAIGDDGGGRRRAAGLAYAYSDASQQELQVIRRQPAQRRESRPNHQRSGKNIAPVISISQPGDRDSKRDIEKCERRPGKKSHAGIRQLQIEPYRLEHGGHDIAIGNIDGVDQAHQNEHIPALNR